MTIIGRLMRFFMERAAKTKSYDDLTRGLTQGEAKVVRAFTEAEDTPRNRATAAHIIGIERWGTQRLRVLLGEPLQRDEYDGYRPPTDRSPAQLAEEFRAARQATLDLTRQLAATGTDLRATVLHNDAGNMRLAGWLVYLNVHASMEATRLRKARS